MRNPFRVALPWRSLVTGALVVLVLGALVLSAAHFERWRTIARQERVVAAQVEELDRQLGQLAVVPRLLADDPRTVAAIDTHRRHRSVPQTGCSNRRRQAVTRMWST